MGEDEDINGRLRRIPHDGEKTESETDLFNIDMKNEDVGYWRAVIFSIAKESNDWNQDYLDELRKNSPIKAMYTKLKNEFKGMLRKTSIEAAEIVLEKTLTLFASHKDPKEIMKEIDPKNWFKITANVVLLAAVVLIIGGAVVSSAFRSFLDANAIWITVVAIAGVAVYIYMIRRD